MKPVYQTKLSPPDGNCFEACIASILELSLDAVPAFGCGEHFFADFRVWLAERNLTAYVWQYVEGGWKPPGYSMLGVRAEGSSIGHEVVALDGEIVHDPWPHAHDAKYIREEWTVFGVIDPSKAQQSA